MTLKELMNKYTFNEIKAEFYYLWRRNKQKKPDNSIIRRLQFDYLLCMNWHSREQIGGYIHLKCNWNECIPLANMNCVVFDEANHLQGPVASHTLREIWEMQIHVAEGVQLTEPELASGLYWETFYLTSDEKAEINRRLFLKRKCIADFTEEELVYVQQSGYYVEDIDNMYDLRCNKLANFDFKGYTSLMYMAAETGKRLLEKQKSLEIITIGYQNNSFPQSLRRISGRTPLFIHLKGNQELLYKQAVAIVGARKADSEGCRQAYRLAKEYAGQRYVIVSGLATGCDSAAHRGCLDAGGETIAVVASGLDITHPKTNVALQQEILDKGGLLLSEQLVRTKARPATLVARTRLQAALSDKLIVVQCPIISGTMYAVQFACELNKPVYAVQYDNYGELSTGNEYIIKTGIGGGNGRTIGSSGANGGCLTVRYALVVG